MFRSIDENSPTFSDELIYWKNINIYITSVSLSNIYYLYIYTKTSLLKFRFSLFMLKNWIHDVNDVMLN